MNDNSVRIQPCCGVMLNRLPHHLNLQECPSLNCKAGLYFAPNSR